MKTLDQIFSLKPQILELAKKYGIDNIRIFGSVARKEDTENSDLDLLLSVRDSSFFNMVHFKYEMEDMVKRKVDVVSDKGLNPLLAPYIFEDVIPL